MVKVTGVYVLGDESVESDYMNIDYVDTLALYLLGTCIGVKKSRKTRFFVEAKEWRAWAVKFMNAKISRIAKLLRTLDTNSL